jgi:hypothetical protein
LTITAAWADVEERRPLLVLDVDQLERLHRGGLVDRSDAGDELALVAHLVDREIRLVGRHAERLEMPDGVLGDVLVRDDGLHARMLLRARGVDVEDACAVVRRAQSLAGEHARSRPVGHVLRAPGDVRHPVVAGKPCADRLHREPPFEAAFAAAVPFATDSTAAMILT